MEICSDPERVKSKAGVLLMVQINAVKAVVRAEILPRDVL